MDLSFSSLNVYHALKYRKKRGRDERFSKKHHSTSVNNDVYIRRNNGKHNLLTLVSPPFYGPCSLNSACGGRFGVAFQNIKRFPIKPRMFTYEHSVAYLKHEPKHSIDSHK